MEVGGLADPGGTVGNVLFLLFPVSLVLLFNCTMWACLGGRVGSFLSGLRPIATLSILTGCWSSGLIAAARTSWGEPLPVLLL